MEVGDRRLAIDPEQSAVGLVAPHAHRELRRLAVDEYAAHEPAHTGPTAEPTAKSHVRSPARFGVVPTRLLAIAIPRRCGARGLRVAAEWARTSPYGQNSWRACG